MFLVSSLVEIGPIVLEKTISNFVDVFLAMLLFSLLGNGRAIHVNKL